MIYMDNYLNIALPKGRLGEKVYDMFESIGYACPSIKENNRKLIFENDEKGNFDGNGFVLWLDGVCRL